ncbi:MAG: hypothetical protein ACRD0J_17865 [Acidimicrobiales bacterium]
MRGGWLSLKDIKLHLVVLAAVAGCVAATWWQAGRALGGNGLSWAYTFEWPCFAVFAMVAWWKLLHETGPVVEAASGTPGRPATGLRWTSPKAGSLPDPGPVTRAGADVGAGLGADVGAGAGSRPDGGSLPDPEIDTAEAALAAWASAARTAAAREAAITAERERAAEQGSWHP